MANKDEGAPGVGHNGGPEFTDWTAAEIGGEGPKGEALSGLFKHAMYLIPLGGSAAVLGWAVISAIAAGFGQTAGEFLADGIEKIIEIDGDIF